MKGTNKGQEGRILMIAIIVSLIVILFLLAFGIYFGFRIMENFPEDSQYNFAKQAEQESRYIYGSGSNYWTGTTSPEITIVEFADFACPYCAKSFSTIREISARYPDRIKLVFRNYPIVAEHSLDLALASLCAGEQDKFWPMHDALFLNQGVKDAEKIIELARQIGAEEARFRPCLESRKYIAEVQQDVADGQALEITGTPAWFINGFRVSGDVPREVFLGFIENILREDGSN